MVNLTRALETQLQVQEFLYHEAELLDRRRFRDWLNILADDFIYKMPARHTVYWKSLDDEFEDLEHGMMYFDEDKESMSTRVYKLETNTAWAEVPPSRTRRLITNVRVKQSSGHARIMSEVRRGTSVRLYLPRHHMDFTVEPAKPGPDLVEGGAERVLLVEDDDMVRSFAAAQLRELGYQVTLAENGVIARGILRRGKRFDLIVTDVVMPGGVGGREVAQIAIQQQPDVKVLFISGYTRDAILQHGRVDPGLRLLSKPFTRAQLARAVREALGVPAPADQA